jgi:hypothetical protein
MLSICCGVRLLWHDTLVAKLSMLAIRAPWEQSAHVIAQNRPRTPTSS